jgi:hypothetical protein
VVTESPGGTELNSRVEDLSEPPPRPSNPALIENADQEALSSRPSRWLFL